LAAAGRDVYVLFFNFEMFLLLWFNISSSNLGYILFWKVHSIRVAHVWDIRSSKQMFKLQGHTKWIRYVEHSHLCCAGYFD
jgi:WD40 repeat protein